MPSVYDFKPKFQNFLRPVLSAWHKAGVTPNQITWAALLGSFAAGALVLQAPQNPLWLLILPVWLFLRMALNALDGMMAREFNLKSPGGQILNETGDIVSDAALYLPLAYLRPDAFWAIVFFVFGALMTEFCGVVGQTLGAQRHYEGPMGKSDRAFWVGALALVSAFIPQAGIYWKVFFSAAAVLTVMTCINRVKHILEEVKNG